MNYLFLFFTFFFINTPTETNELTLTISNIKQLEGRIEIGLFDVGGRFLEEGQAYKTVSFDVKANSETIVIKNLPKGNYAVSLYHDKNSNGKCDRNFLGIPKEPYAFSNNFKPKFSAPTFKDCEFDLTSNQSMEIMLIH